jgi:uncharacterized protein (TIGR03435 family)
MKRRNWLALLATSASVASGQPTPVLPAFDAASVRIHKAESAEEVRNGPWIQTSPGGVTMRNAKLLWSVGWAFDAKDWLISGPEWINSERYDIVAKTERAVSVAQLKLMLQTLLVERFNLVLHHETKELPVAVLVLGKNGPKNLRPAAATGPPDGPRPVGGKQGPGSLAYKSVSMSDFAERLGGPPPLGVGERVVDGTGLTGAFDLNLEVDSENFVGGRDEFAEFLKAAIEQQFGLKMERRKMPLDTLVIDQGNRVPVEN